jgi:hypothetical protein
MDPGLSESGYSRLGQQRLLGAETCIAVLRRSSKGVEFRDRGCRTTPGIQCPMCTGMYESMYHVEKALVVLVCAHHMLQVPCSSRTRNGRDQDANKSVSLVRAPASKLHREPTSVTTFTSNVRDLAVVESSPRITKPMNTTTEQIAGWLR